MYNRQCDNIRKTDHRLPGTVRHGTLQQDNTCQKYKEQPVYTIHYVD